MSELSDLAADLRSAGAGARPFVRKALEVTARNIKDDWADGAKRTGLDGYAASIDYDISEGPFRVVAEVGPNPDRNKQGVLGAVEDADGGWKSQPQHAGRDALEANEEDFYDGLAKAAADAILEGLGL
jgi:hypothetical protein